MLMNKFVRCGQRGLARCVVLTATMVPKVQLRLSSAVDMSKCSKTKWNVQEWRVENMREIWYSLVERVNLHVNRRIVA